MAGTSFWPKRAKPFTRKHNYLNSYVISSISSRLTTRGFFLIFFLRRRRFAKLLNRPISNTTDQLKTLSMESGHTGQLATQSFERSLIDKLRVDRNRIHIRIERCQRAIRKAAQTGNLHEPLGYLESPLVPLVDGGLPEKPLKGTNQVTMKARSSETLFSTARNEPAHQAGTPATLGGFTATLPQQPHLPHRRSRPSQRCRARHSSSQWSVWKWAQHAVRHQ